MSTNQNAPWGTCFLCGERILTAFSDIAIARGRRRTWTARIHETCRANITNGHENGRGRGLGRPITVNEAVAA